MSVYRHEKLELSQKTKVAKIKEAYSRGVLGGALNAQKMPTTWYPRFYDLGYRHGQAYRKEFKKALTLPG